jgi:hypothetical protein
MNSQRAHSLVSAPLWTVWVTRWAIGALWIYEGIWVKIIVRDTHELHIVSNGTNLIGLSGGLAMPVIGFLEGVLGVLAISGWRQRWIAGVSGLLLLTMTASGIWQGAEPASLVVHNLPAFAGIILLGFSGEEYRAREVG